MPGSLTRGTRCAKGAWHSPQFLDGTYSTIVGSARADDIAVIIHVDPCTAADMRPGVWGNPHPVCLDDLCFWCQLKVERSGFARLRICVRDRCLERSIDNDSDFINANCEATGGVMACGIGFNDPGKITFVCRFYPDIGAFDGTSGEIPHNPFKSGRSSPDAECCKQKANEAKNK
jgi:hypothetical protein